MSNKASVTIGCERQWRGIRGTVRHIVRTGIHPSSFALVLPGRRQGAKYE